MRIGIGHLIAGYGGNPYTADNIDVFDDVNWPPVDSGLVDRGMDLLTGLGFGLRGFHGFAGGMGDDTLIGDPGFQPGLPTLDPSLNPNFGADLPVITGGLTVPSSTSSGGLTPAQLANLIAVSGSAAGTAIKATQSPYLIPGTNAIYNPQTGQIGNASGLFSASSMTNLSSMMPMLLIFGVGLFALSKLGGK